MIAFRTTVIAAAMAMALSVSMPAQQSGKQQDQQMQGMHGQMQHGQMHGMMQECHNKMQSLMTSNRQTQKDIQAARDSNDPSKMRAALDEADKAFTAMNDHMNNCMSMMGNHGMMGGKPDKSRSQQPPQ